MSKVDNYTRALWVRKPNNSIFWPLWEQSFNIEPFPNERSRLPFRMSDVDRARRKQWLKDQILSPNEPRSVPELQKLLYNPIRRFYRMPMDYLFLKLHPFLGPCTGALRAAIPKIGIGIIVLWSMFYHVKYRRESWERIKGLSVRLIPTRTQHSKIPCIVKPKEHWYDLGFRQRKVFRGDEYKGTYDENPVPLKYWE